MSVNYGGGGDDGDQGWSGRPDITHGGNSSYLTLNGMRKYKSDTGSTMYDGYIRELAGNQPNN